MKRTHRPTTTFQKLSRRRQPDDRGLTLVELLMVITILGILAGIALFSARNLRGEATASATSTDSDVIRAAQEAYCYKTGDYATRLRQMTIPPNDVLADDDTYNVSVRFESDNYPNFGSDDPENSVFKGFRAGGAGALGESAIECGSYEVGPRDPNFAGTGGQVLTDEAVIGPVGFLSQPFRDRFGSLGFPIGNPSALLTRATTPQANDWLWVSSRSLDPSPTVVSTRREFATGRLALMACKSGGLSIPVTESCRAPGVAGTVQTPTDIDDLNHFSGGVEPTMAILVSRLVAAPVNCANQPLLVMQSTGTTFGDAARDLLELNGLAATVIADLETPARRCIISDPDLSTARSLMRGGGASAGGSDIMLPAKYALLSQEAAMDPTGEDTNWHPDVTGQNTGTPLGPISMFAGLIDRPATADPSHRAQALRFLNYLLSPLGQATLQTYGFGAPTVAVTPVPEA